MMCAMHSDKIYNVVNETRAELLLEYFQRKVEMCLPSNVTTVKFETILKAKTKIKDAAGENDVCFKEKGKQVNRRCNLCAVRALTLYTEVT